MRDPTEHEFVPSDTRHGRNPSTTLSRRTVSHRTISQTHASRSRGLLNRCWSYHIASISDRPKTPNIIIGMVRKNSYVDDESKNKRSVSKLKYPVEHG